MKTAILTTLLAIAPLSMTAVAQQPEYDNSGTPRRVIVYPEQCNNDDWYEWEDWTTGNILFVEGFYGGMGYGHSIDVQRRLPKDSSNPAWQMRILNYHRNHPREGEEGELDELIIQYNPQTKKIYIPTQDFGMRTAVEDAEGVKGIPGYITGYETFYPDRTSPYAYFDEEEGTMRIHTLIYWEGILLDDGTRGRYVYTESYDDIKLDGFTDYNIHILADKECVSETSQTVHFDMTDDPHDVCYDIVYGLATDNKVEEIAQAKKNPLTQSCDVEFQLQTGLNTIVAVSYDRQDKRYVNTKEIYCMPEEPGLWKNIGTGRFTEDAVSGFGSEMGIPSYDVQVEERTDKPGYYRIVNPYAQYVKDYQGMTVHEGHNHYLYFDATTPSQVMMPQMHTGITDEKLGDIYITSMAYEEMMQGKMRIEYAKYLGKVDQGVICFPKESIGIKLPSYYAGNIWWVNTSESFGLRLPETGVNQVETADDTPVEYYDMQGMRLVSPTPGTICIVKRGAKFAKEVIQ